MIIEEKTLMAVWKYDLPPFYLAGEVTKMYKDGMVAIKGYNGMVFNPVKVLPYDQEKIKCIKDLQLEYALESKKLQQNIKTKAEDVLFNIFA